MLKPLQAFRITQADAVKIAEMFNRFYSNVGDCLRQLTDKHELDNVILNDVALTAGVTNAVEHGLRRQPRGWFTTDVNAAAVIHRLAWDTTTLTLETTANCTVNLWVY